ncbi:hypothetical protein HN681_00555 [archaeon]|jgi:hypothetical protein|nr:hypothetical protein [archaeon]MBT3730724.1 hypothetical protein [archaeon]MBT4669626.1 hypothetical protein [archaeon]MBT5030383.1 hypothetical protein [archaeon]MBT5288324.1 hypothetical protein [archaeon]
MFRKIEKLLLQRLVLNSKKFELVEELDVKSYTKSVKTLNKLHLVITKEIIVNKKLNKSLLKLHMDEKFRNKFVKPIVFNLSEINEVLLEESKVLRQVNFFSVGFSYVSFILSGKDGYFLRKIRKFKSLSEKEVELNHVFFELSEELPKRYQLNNKKFKKSWKLLLQLQRELHKLAKNVGNSKVVKLHAERILVIISSLQKTEIYEFIRLDVDYIKTKVKYIVDHPKESKIAYALATVYIVSPGTFEMTGAVLFFRYLGKYTISKAKKIKKKRRRKS